MQVIYVQEEGTTGELYREKKDAWANNAWTEQTVVSNAPQAYREHAEVSGYMYLVLLLHTISAKSRGNLQAVPAVLPVNTPIPQHIRACSVQTRQTPHTPHVLCTWSRQESLRGAHASHHEASEPEQVCTALIYITQDYRPAFILQWAKGPVHLPTSTRRPCKLAAASSGEFLLSGKWGEGNRTSVQSGY